MAPWASFTARKRLRKGILVYQGAIDDNQRGTGKANYVVNAVTQLKAGEPVSPSETKSYGCGVKY